MGNVWAGSTAHVQFKRSDVRAKCKTLSINLATYGVKKGGLLQEMIDAAERPASYSTLRKFIRLLDVISKDSAVARMLSTPIVKLFPRDIKLLFQHIDNAIISLDVKHKASLVQSFRHYLVRCNAALATGDRITFRLAASQTKHLPGVLRTGLQARLPPRRSDVFAEEYLTLPLEAIPFDSLEDRSKKALAHQSHALNAILETCTKALDDHEERVSAIRKYKATPLPLCLAPDIIQAVTQGDQLRYSEWRRIPDSECLHVVELLIERHHFHKIPPQKWFNIGLCEPLRCKHVSWARQRREYLLSDYYLPRDVLVACSIILVLRTAWNVSTALSLSLSDIEESALGGFNIVGLKPKTDQFQEAFVADELTPPAVTIGLTLSDDDCVRALRLLIQHRRNIDLVYNPSSSPFFAHSIFTASPFGTNLKCWEIHFAICTRFVIIQTYLFIASTIFGI